MRTRHAELAFTALALGIAATVAWIAFGYSFGSSYFPRALAIVMGALAALYGLRLLARPAGTIHAASGAADGAGPKLRAAALAFGGIVAYAFAIRVAGYDLATFAFLLGLMALLGSRGWLRMTLIAGGITAALHLIFFEALGVPMPDSLLV